MARSKGDDHGGSTGGRSRGPGGGRSIGATHNTAARTAAQGRTKRRHANPPPATHSGDPAVTLPTSPHKSGTPEGHPTLIDPEQGDEARRSLNRENSVATLLAAEGYRTTQNPSKAEVAEARAINGDTGTPSSKPDYLLEGRVFDCYSPKPTTTVRNIWSYVEDKIQREQTQRVIVDLKEWKGDMADIGQQFHDWPITKLKELKIITPADKIVQILPVTESS